MIVVVFKFIRGDAVINGFFSMFSDFILFFDTFKLEMENFYEQNKTLMMQSTWYTQTTIETNITSRWRWQWWFYMWKWIDINPNRCNEKTLDWDAIKIFKCNQYIFLLY